jgi:GT2 family glycosyltransferase
MNRAFRLSQGRYLLSLNPDTIVESKAFEKLVAFLDNTPAAAAAGCRTLYPDGSLQLTCREFPSIATVLWRWLHLERFYQPGFYRRSLMIEWAHDVARPVDWVMGSCLLLRRQATFDIGLFDEGYYLYYEDIDLCFRLKHRGMAVYYVPEACITHEYQRHSARGLFNRKTLWHAQSIFRYFSKHGWCVI